MNRSLQSVVSSQLGSIETATGQPVLGQRHGLLRGLFPEHEESSPVPWEFVVLTRRVDDGEL
jgi:hypothetical protein